MAKWVAGVLLALTVAIALVPRVTLWRLIELKMELLIQCVPAFVLGARWPRLREGPVFAGLVVGTAIAVGGVMAGMPRIASVHTGVVALGANVIVAAVGTLRRRGPSQLAATGRGA
jgi:Na+/proline symporter